MNEHILLVDDDQNFCFSAELALKKRGYRISVTGDGWEALSMIRAAVHAPHAIDLVLLDMELPTMSGIEVLSRLRGGGINVATIVISGHVRAETYRELLALGCLAIVFKPISERNLVAKVKEILQGPASGPLAPNGLLPDC